MVDEKIFPIQNIKMKMNNLLIITKYFIVYPLILVGLLDIKVAIAVNIHNDGLVPSNVPQRQGEFVGKMDIVKSAQTYIYDYLYVPFSFQGHINILQPTL